MSDVPATYPLAWPSGRPRTAAALRRFGHFGTVLRSEFDLDQPSKRKAKPITLTEARERLAAELSRLGARLSTVSTNIAPRSGGRHPSDPGVAVYFDLNGTPIVLACDSFTEVAQNIGAIAAHIDAMRRMERYGVATTEMLFTGHMRLPSPISPNDWRGPLGDPVTLAQAEAEYRRRMRTAHPDTGGSHAAAAVLNAAIEKARSALR